MKSNLSKLKKGEYFKFAGKSKIYKYEGKIRMYSSNGKFKGWGYSYVPVNDVWGGGNEKFTDAIVEIGFEY
jgi:hypothetical protein